MKKLFLTYLFIFWLSPVLAQKQVIDSLKHQLSIVRQDTSRALILAELSYVYRNSDVDTSFIYAQESLRLAKKIKFAKAEIRALNDFGFYYRVKGDLLKALNYQNTALKIAENSGDLYEIGFTSYLIGIIYLDLRDYNNAIEVYINKSLKIFEKLGNKERQIAILLNLSVAYRLNNQPKPSYNTLQKARGLIDKATSKETLAFYFSELGTTQFDLGNHQIGLENQKKAVKIYQSTNNLRRLSTVYNSIAIGFDKIMQLDSCAFYAQKGFLAAESMLFKRELLIAAKLLAKTFESKDSKKAIEYYKIAMQINDELYGINNVLKLQKIVFEEQEKQRKAEVEQINAKNRLKQYLFAIAFFTASLIGYIFYKNNQNQKKTNIALEKTLSELKTTQNQLIQKEKLASLGELTAGIAHEIQNPLNFVNNFSELSVGIAEDLKEEINRPELDKEYIDELLTDLGQNQEKINLHGKRASSIVKGMLEHSRASTGERSLTNINALCDEYLRLSFHGLRAKDKNFQSDFKTEFEESIPKIELVSQDFGRVLLNLFNNAFYAVNQRNAATTAVETGHALSLPSPTSQYKPMVIVSTKKIGDTIEISVQDNGGGIPENIKSKIFQPFFTTKPTGEGTGLGLSLSYDIITKGHGGTLNIESIEGQGTTFVISLPIK